MIKKFTRCLLFPFAVLAVWLVPGVVLGALDGDLAPALNVHEWLKGGPVEIKPGTNIFVLEILEIKFEAGKAAITNLSDLQNRFRDKGVIMVGVSDETVGLLKEYVAHHDKDIGFALAADNGRHTALAFMKPINQYGVPYSFIIGTNGDLLWHGIPQHGLLEGALTKIVAGHYNEAVAAKNDLSLHQLEQYVLFARQGSSRTEMAGQTLLADRTNNLPLLLEMANAIATIPNLAIRNFGLADQALKQAEALAPTNPPPVEMVRAVWLFESGQRQAGLDRAIHAADNARGSQEKAEMQKMVKHMKDRVAAKQSEQAEQNNAEPDRLSTTNQTAGGQTGQNTNSAGP